MRSRLLLVGAAVALLGAGGCGSSGGDDDAACSPARAAAPGTVATTLRSGGRDRTYSLTVPESYDGETAAPLVVNLHGFGGTGDQQDQSTDMRPRAGARGYVVVAPDGGPLSVQPGAPGAEDAGQYDGIPFWNVFADGAITFGGDDGEDLPVESDAIGADDVAFIDALLDEVAAELCIDEDRVYATGMSNGAGMASALGCALDHRLAAIAPVAGVNLSASCPGEGAIPVLAIHGDADDAIHFEGNYLLGFELGNPSVPDRMAQWAERNGCDPDAELAAAGTGVARYRWNGCEATTELRVVSRWGHSWPAVDGDPAGPFDATEVVLDFFDAHPRSD